MGKFSDPTLSIFFIAIPFQKYVTKVITQPVFYGDLVYKLEAQIISLRREQKYYKAFAVDSMTQG